MPGQTDVSPKSIHDASVNSSQGMYVLAYVLEAEVNIPISIINETVFLITLSMLKVIPQ